MFRQAKSAPWAVKLAVGEKPALVGKKLQQSYFRGPNYFEVDMDIASSSTAARILTLVRSLSTSLIVDVGVTIEVWLTSTLLPQSPCLAGRCLSVVRCLLSAAV